FYQDNYIQVVRYLVAGYGCPAHEAEDCAQDAFMTVRARWEDVRRLNAKKAYLFMVARKQFQRLWSRREYLNHEDALENHLSCLADPSDAFEEADIRSAA